MMIDEIEEGVEYALLLSTCAGVWRYLIGDTIRIINKEKAKLLSPVELSIFEPLWRTPFYGKYGKSNRINC